jgi:hypothetical protein
MSVARETRRVRRCPLCTGALIASIRSVHISEAEVLNLWVCDDCGHSSVQEAAIQARLSARTKRLPESFVDV